MRWFQRWFSRLQGEELVQWEEAECLEDLSRSFLAVNQGQPILNLSIVEPFIERKDRIESYYWWTEVAKFWLLALAERHPNLRVIESPAFLLVTPYSDQTVNGVLRKIESMRFELLELYDGVAQDCSPGKNVVILFPHQTAYYDYISLFYPDGEFAMSGGIQIRAGYPHIAGFHRDGTGVYFGVMAHEMTHLYLSHLELPRWLDEALAQTYEFSVSAKDRHGKSLKLAPKHQAYWTPQSIQAFWHGDSFHDPQAQDISYDLAVVLMRKLERVLKPEKEDLLGFIKNAARMDAGEAAAQQHLGIGLGELAASFLGPGSWEPRLW